MPRKRSTESELVEKKKRNLKRNRARGNEYERLIAKELRDLGFTSVVTSRSESKSIDNQKVDLIDTDRRLPCYIQIKKTIKTPDYFSILGQCPLKNKPFVIFWAKVRPTESTFRTEGEIVLVPKDFFYKLIKTYGNV